MQYNNRHAYLIMAHQHPDLLTKLLKMLDNPNNDIYIHLDRRSTLNSNAFSKINKYSSCYFIERIPVAWGGVSQIKAELNLLEQATLTGDYFYYHLISGSCLPIKTQKYIHDFFKKNKGLEFVRLDHTANSNRFFLDRIKYYHFLQELIGRDANIMLKILNKVILTAQKFIKIDRTKGSSQNYWKGTSWFSITNKFANHLVSRKDIILKEYKYTHCADEVFLHTELMNNINIFKVAESNARLIDWARGKPYTFKSNDLPLILESDHLFARKFNPEIDCKIIDDLLKRLNIKQEEKNPQSKSNVV